MKNKEENGEIIASIILIICVLIGIGLIGGFLIGTTEFIHNSYEYNENDTKVDVFENWCIKNNHTYISKSQAPCFDRNESTIIVYTVAYIFDETATNNEYYHTEVYLRK